MALKLPRLGTYGIVDPSGRPLSNFQGWINTAFAKIEQAFTSLADQLGLINTAQSTADAANTAAAAAHADALAAQADADAANADLANIASDNILSPVEKKRVIADVNDLNNEKTDIDAKAVAASITTEKTNYDNSLSTLNTYLSGLTSPVPWNNLSDNTTIVGTTFRSNFSDVYLKRQLLLNAIDDKARQTATWTTVTGTGKPADNATVNNVTYSSTAPTGPVDGDIWVDTTGGGIVFKVRKSGAWQVASTANNISTSSTAPTSPVNGDVWVDTSVTPNVTKVRVSGAWVAASNLTTNTNQLTDGANLGVTASWPSVTGSGRPADNATVNRVTYSATPPASPVDGDVWVDTSVTPNLIKVRTSGAWQVGGNYTTILDHLGDGTTYVHLPAATSTGTGTGRRALIDFSHSHVNRDLDHIFDGVTYGRTLVGRLNAGRPVLDFSEGIHYNQILDYINDGSTYARIHASELSGNNHRVGIAGSGYRVGDQRNLPAITGQGGRYKYTGAISYSSTAGSGTATISVASGSSLIGTNPIAYSPTPVTVSGTAGTGPFTYFLYFDDPTYAGGSPAVVATRTGNDIYANDGRVWVGSIDVTFAAAGGGGSTGGGGGGGGTACVVAASWVETQNRGWIRAGQVVAGDLLRCLTEDREDTEWVAVNYNRIVIEPAYKITSESGVTVRVSHTTPLTLRDGSSIQVHELNGHELPVYTDELTWEPCTLEYAQELPVCYISLGGKVYAAGDVKGRSILTHNNTVKP